jgi:hypothetical protein
MMMADVQREDAQPKEKEEPKGGKKKGKETAPPPVVRRPLQTRHRHRVENASTVAPRGRAWHAAASGRVHRHGWELTSVPRRGVREADSRCRSHTRRR